MATKIERKFKSKGLIRGITSSAPQFNSRWPRRDESKKVKDEKDKPPSTSLSSNPKVPTAK